MARIDSAIKMRQRPIAALLELSDPYSGWTSHDYRLQEAFLILDKETCNKCGNPIWFCHSADNRIDFEVKTGTCYAEAEIADYQKMQGKDKELDPGEYLYAVAVGIENEDGSRDPLPSRAEALQKI